MTAIVKTPESFIGMTYIDAVAACKKLKLQHRVCIRDGKFLVLTRDYNPERYNFTVSANTVVDAKVG